MQCIHIPKILREGCVLQRGSHTRVWGWYEKNTEIIIDFQQQIYKTVTDEKGYFETLVKCIETGGPYVLKIFSEDGITAENRDVYVGDVFVCSGQSNMELSVSRVREIIVYRAYLASRYLLYEEDVVWQGPRLKCIQRKETEILLSFETKGEKLLLTTDSEDPGEFEAAGEDKVFHKVNATIEGINIKISSAKDDEIKVKDMKKIRYAWSDAPVKGLLKNSYGLLTAPLCVDLS